MGIGGDIPAERLKLVQCMLTFSGDETVSSAAGNAHGRPVLEGHKGLRWTDYLYKWV